MSSVALIIRSSDNEMCNENTLQYNNLTTITIINILRNIVNSRLRLSQHFADDHSKPPMRSREAKVPNVVTYDPILYLHNDETWMFYASSGISLLPW